MNPVIIEGRVKNKKRVEEYIHALAKELGINRLYSKGIFVKFYTKLDHGAQGLCWGDHKSHAEISIARTSNGDAFTLEEMMQTLAHEMVHAKQYIKGELVSGVGRKPSRWFGKPVKGDNYWDLPWEIEAHGREVGLFVRYCEDNDLGKYKWTQV